MEIAAPRALPLAPPPRAAATDAATAQRFEALIIERLLTTARAARLGDDGLGDDPGADQTRELTDRLRAQAIARAAPLGLAKALAK
ncbi:hypothetical protein IP88_00525 [alpha proteobacterium AAP81b]|nr:hypothetical protein IP88_00525 [alpha proteobacterium AAP81b]